mgnify:CR=1 FL=1
MTPHKLGTKWWVKVRWKNKQLNFAFESEQEALAFCGSAEYDKKIAAKNNTIPAFVQMKIAASQQSTAPIVIDPTNIKLMKTVPLTTFFAEYKKYVDSDISRNTKQHMEYTWKSFTDSLDSSKQYVHQIDTMDFQNWKSYMQNGKKSASTVNSYLKRLKAMFNWGVSQGYIKKSPCNDIKSPKNENLPKPYLTKKEQEVLLKAAKNHNDDIYMFILLGLMAGMRRNEILFAKWEWINFRRDEFLNFGSITIQSIGEDFKPKSRQARTIPITKTLAIGLMSHHQSQYIAMPKKQEADLAKAVEFIKHPRGYIIKPEIVDVNLDSGVPRWNYRTMLDTVLKKCNLGKINRYGEEQPVSAHILRHTYATMLAQSGKSAMEIMLYCGHQDIKTSEQYIHMAKATHSDYEKFAPSDWLSIQGSPT